MRLIVTPFSMVFFILPCLALFSTGVVKYTLVGVGKDSQMADLFMEGIWAYFPLMGNIVSCWRTKRVRRWMKYQLPLDVFLVVVTAWKWYALFELKVSSDTVRELLLMQEILWILLPGLSVTFWIYDNIRREIKHIPEGQMMTGRLKRCVYGFSLPLILLAGVTAIKWNMCPVSMSRTCLILGILQDILWVWQPIWSIVSYTIEQSARQNRKDEHALHAAHQEVEKNIKVTI